LRRSYPVYCQNEAVDEGNGTEVDGVVSKLILIEE
jgi:hypothetical protein